MQELVRKGLYVHKKLSKSYVTHGVAPRWHRFPPPKVPGEEGGAMCGLLKAEDVGEEKNRRSIRNSGCAEVAPIPPAESSR